MKIKELFDRFDGVFDLALQEEYDNSGRQITLDKEANGVVVALDVTMHSLNICVQEGVNVLLTHHPLLFDTLRTIDADDYVGGLVAYATEHGISVYSAHTCFDNALGGMNYVLANMLGLSNVQPMQPFGVVGDTEPISLRDLAHKVEKILGDQSVVHTLSGDVMISRISLCTGSGGRDRELIESAMTCSNVFISSEFKHNLIRYTIEKDFAVIQCSHYNSEYIFVDAAKKIIENNLKNVKVICEKQETVFRKEA